MRSTTRSLPVHTSPGEDPIVPTHSPGEACQRKLSTFVDFVSNICGAPLLVFVLHMALIRWTHRSICAMIRNRATRSEHLNSESTADLGGCSEGCMEPKPASLRSVSAIRNHNFSVCPLSNHINWGIMHPKSAKSSQTHRAHVSYDVSACIEISVAVRLSALCAASSSDSLATRGKRIPQLAEARAGLMTFHCLWAFKSIQMRFLWIGHWTEIEVATASRVWLAYWMSTIDS